MNDGARSQAQVCHLLQHPLNVAKVPESMVLNEAESLGPEDLG